MATKTAADPDTVDRKSSKIDAQLDLLAAQLLDAHNKDAEEADSEDS